MQNYGHLLVKTARKSLFFQKCPQFSQKLSASTACMLASFSMSDIPRYVNTYSAWYPVQIYALVENTYIDG